MKLLSLILVFYAFTSFASGGYHCTTKNRSITVSGTIGAGEEFATEAFIKFKNDNIYYKLNLTNQWVNYTNNELKLYSYSGIEDVVRLRLESNNGNGTLYLLNLSDIRKEGDVLFKDLKVSCILE